MLSNAKPKESEWQLMGSSQVVCLGYQCQCGAAVVVYRFTKTDGHWNPDQAAKDRIVECPQCQMPRPILVVEIQQLNQWAEEMKS
jgi:hypothetical protein